MENGSESLHNLREYIDFLFLRRINPVICEGYNIQPGYKQEMGLIVLCPGFLEMFIANDYAYKHPYDINLALCVLLLSSNDFLTSVYATSTRSCNTHHELQRHCVVSECEENCILRSSDYVTRVNDD
ncbi:hypothetical protein WA026_010338 [Henosepilachna vigintioctopunctata]|uniref:Uncharacterized protein n=1 Tax=Henosepilachna vigintioctopunctata TaxID=420089 RepID=A0AAW1VDS9_9CUCU